MPYIGRFAPSPTGPLHLGSLTCALASYLDAKAAGGRWLVRIEDLDPPREKPGASDDILRTLEMYGLHWDGEVVFQSRRHAHYEEALSTLVASGRVFRCSLSRAQLEPFGARHPGRLFSETHFDEAAGFAWRFDPPPHSTTFNDRIQGQQVFDVAHDEGPFVIRRREGFFAYQLAVVVDDALQGITDIVRGSDLLDSTPRQILLQNALQLPTPRYAHIPVLADDRGAKLSKQLASAPVTEPTRMKNLRLALLALGQETPANADNPQTLLSEAARLWQPARISRVAAIPVAALEHQGH